MNWLSHKFAQAAESGLLAGVLSVALSTGVVTGVYDFNNDDPDNIRGKNGEAIVQVFEGKISELNDLQITTGEITVRRSAALIDGDISKIGNLDKELETNITKTHSKAERIKRELHLTPAISEQDFISIADIYNEQFPLGRHNIDTSNAGYLHDAQISNEVADYRNVSDVDNGEDRNELAGQVRGSMYSKGDVAVEGYALLGLLSLIVGGAIGAGFDTDEAKRRARQLSPQSPFSKWKEARDHARQRKINQKNKLN